MKTSHYQHETFRQIWLAFNANLGAIREFSLNISRLADEQDQKRLNELIHKAALLFDDDPDAVRQEVLSIVSYADDMEFEPKWSENPDAREYLEAVRSGEFHVTVKKWLRGKPAKMRDVAEIFELIFQQPTHHGVLLRKSALINAVSFYENLLVGLLRTYYGLTNTQASDDEDCFLDTPQISKPIRKVIYFGGLNSRLNHLETLDVNLEFLRTKQQSLNEIAERRNLFVHNNGLVNQRYLKNTNRVDEKEQIGRQFRVSTSYLLDTIDTLYFCGFLILQQCWRTWVNGSHKQADKNYVNVLFSLLRQERNELAVQLGEAATNFKMQGHEAQMVAINHAIALRDLGRPDEFPELLNKLEKKPASKSVEIALSILRQEYDRAIILITQTKEKNKLASLYNASPLFRPLQNDPRFARFTQSTERKYQ